MMDSGQIDFYQHDTVCSNTCRSTKFDVLINSTRLPPGTSVQPGLSCLPLDPLGGQVPPLTGEIVHEAAEVEEPLEEKLSTAAEWSPGRVQPVNPTTANGHAAKRKRTDTPDGVLSLWQGVADSGLMREVLSSLQTELLATLKGVEARSEKANLRETDAVILNSLCKMFGLLDSVKQALSLKRSQDEENKMHQSVYVLDDILEGQRKLVYDKCSSKIHSLKHLRQQRHNPSNSQTNNLLSPVKTSPGIQPSSVNSLSAASYAQLAINSQILNYSSTSTGRGYYAGRTQREAGLEREQEFSEMANHEKFHRQESTGTSGIHKEPGQRTIRLQGDPSLGREEKEETEGLHDVEKVVIGAKVLKKHKSK
ncbi:glucocorticoid modulatory element-binding protein 1-like isoform X2 [Xyrichtys novacula]|nr:glucocorticoid modulatory element-binding protein 1-like isoform X2 [Xyrichtys novacula]